MAFFPESHKSELERVLRFKGQNVAIKALSGLEFAEEYKADPVAYTDFLNSVIGVRHAL